MLLNGKKPLVEVIFYVSFWWRIQGFFLMVWTDSWVISLKKSIWLICAYQVCFSFLLHSEAWLFTIVLVASLIGMSFQFQVYRQSYSADSLFQCSRLFLNTSQHAWIYVQIRWIKITYPIITGQEKGQLISSCHWKMGNLWWRWTLNSKLKNNNCLVVLKSLCVCLSSLYGGDLFSALMDWSWSIRLASRMQKLFHALVIQEKWTDAIHLGGYAISILFLLITRCICSVN
jgi:hypothetical protein